MLDLLSPQFTQIIVHPKLQACSVSKAGHFHPDFPPFEGKIIIRYILQEVLTHWWAPVLPSPPLNLDSPLCSDFLPSRLSLQGNPVSWVPPIWSLGWSGRRRPRSQKCS